MKEDRARVAARRDAALDIVVLTLETDLARACAPGQFLNVAVPVDGVDPFLRRPFSVAWTDPAAGTLELMIRRRGRGTQLLCELAAGARLSLLGPLGKGFNVAHLMEAPAVDLVAGGVGAPPLIMLAHALGPRANVRLFLGARTRAGMPEPERISTRVPGVRFATDDGSLGMRGTALDAYRAHGREQATVCACGPVPLLEALRKLALESGRKCYLSLEAEMACGWGVCQGCVVRRADGAYARVCCDGPVFAAEELGPL